MGHLLDLWPQLAPVRCAQRPAPATPTDRVGGTGSERRSARGQRASRPGTHHGHHGPRAHVLDQAAEEGALSKLRVVLAQQLLRGLETEGMGPLL